MLQLVASMRGGVANLLRRAPALRPKARSMSGVPGKEQMNAAAARAGDEAANVGASIGESVQKLQWWTSAKEFAYFMGQAVNVLNLPVGVAAAGGLAVFEVYAWFCVGEVIGKRQLIGYPVKDGKAHH